MRHLPFPIVEGTAAERTQDYPRHRHPHRLRRLKAPARQPECSIIRRQSPNDANWQALNRVLRRQARFLTWYFVLIALEGVCFGLLARRYGDWQRTLRAPRYRVRLWLIRTFILPNISEWHLLLTSFNWPRREDVDVSIDILQNDGILYQGRVADYFIDPDGKLTGILLENVKPLRPRSLPRGSKTSRIRAAHLLGSLLEDHPRLPLLHRPKLHPQPQRKIRSPRPDPDQPGRKNPRRRRLQLPTK
jgi:hypothetical protein